MTNFEVNSTLSFGNNPILVAFGHIAEIGLIWKATSLSLNQISEVGKWIICMKIKQMCSLLPYKHIDMLHDGIEKITFPAWMKISLL